MTFELLLKSWYAIACNIWNSPLLLLLLCVILWALVIILIIFIWHCIMSDALNCETLEFEEKENDS